MKVSIWKKVIYIGCFEGLRYCKVEVDVLEAKNKVNKVFHFVYFQKKTLRK